MQNFIIRITQENTELLNDEKIGCFILPDSVSSEFAESFINQARQKNKLVLADGDNALAFYQKFNPDGFILNTVKQENPRKFIENIRKQAKKAIIGAISRNRRHEAMLVSEAEPDFIIFQFWKDGLSNNIELLEWYNEFFLIQNAAWPQDEMDTTLIKSDFVIINDTEYQSLSQKFA